MCREGRRCVVNGLQICGDEAFSRVEKFVPVFSASREGVAVETRASELGRASEEPKERPPPPDSHNVMW